MTLSAEEYANNDDSELFKRIKAQKWDEVAAILGSEDGRAMAREPDEYGNLPLHTAIGFKAPDKLILSLLELHPEACSVHGTDHWLPLHIAAMWGTSSEVMEAIIRQHPQALDDAGDPGIKGRTPRHFSHRFAHNKEALERSTSEWVRIAAAGRVEDEADKAAVA